MRNIRYLAFLLLLPFSLLAQNQLTSSPYSMYGIGEIITGLYGQNSAMGGVSYGMRDPWLLNVENPAGLTGMDSMKIYAEASMFIKNSWYSSAGDKHNAFTGNLSSFLLGTKIWKGLYMAVGLAPYTGVGYYFRVSEEVQGSPGSYSISTFQGDGGLSKAFVSGGIDLPYNLSAGVNLNYYFGNVYRYETQSVMSYTEGFRANLFHADFGLQYSRALGKETFLTVGLVYGYRQKYKLYNFKYIYTSTTATELYAKNRDQYIPEHYGIGASLQRKKMTYALDYTFRKSSVLTTTASKIRYQDTHDARLGICYDPQGRNFDSFRKQMKYKAGLNISTPDYVINGKSGIHWRASVGVAIPMLTGLLNTALFYDQLLINGKFQQKSLGVTVSYTLAERMFKVKL